MEEKHLYTSEEKLKWWGYGEWVEEPDEINFEHEGIACRVVRIKIEEGSGYIFGGHLCGYCKLPEYHAYINSVIQDIDIETHYGITYAQQTESGFWIGFDCAHCYDIIPSMKLSYEKWMSERPDLYSKIIYRNIQFCIDTCKSMAEQLKKVIYE